MKTSKLNRSIALSIVPLCTLMLFLVACSNRNLQEKPGEAEPQTLLAYDYTTLTGADIEQGKYSVEAELSQLSNEMMFTIKVDSSDLDFRIPFPTFGTTPADITVDWGDGSEVTTEPTSTTLTENHFNHTYGTADNYTITITSSQTDATKKQIPNFNFYYYSSSSAKKLISMDTPMLNTGTMDFNYCFNGCTNLTSLPKGLFNANTQATDFRQCFYNCTNLVLNKKIFSTAANLDEGKTRFSGMTMDFRLCFQNTGSGLTAEQQGQSVAPRLWEYEGSATWTNADCYTGCKASNLTGISAGWASPLPLPKKAVVWAIERM